MTPMGSVHFFVEEIHFKVPHPRKKSNWIKETIASENKELGELNFIFCSDAYLHKINHQYLNHDSFTDIITFDNSERKGTVEGDIFISIDRVKENSILFRTGFAQELSRVIIHGVLHLIGYSDKNANQRSKMRIKEDAYLSLLKK